MLTADAGNNKIDQLTIYMRPIAVAQKCAEVINQRLQPTMSTQKRR